MEEQSAQENSAGERSPSESSEATSQESRVSNPIESNKSQSKPRPPLIFVILLFGLIAVFVWGLRWVFTLGAQDTGSVPFLVFDYAVGLTMIFLPCTLPLAFVIVPLVMGKSYGKGIGMVLAFGLGVTATLSLYGALIGFLGQALGVNQVETAKNILYAAAGALALLFALGELGLIRFTSPTYSGGVPQVILRQKDIAKAALLGLFMGNVGVGCPNPLFNAVIIPQIVATGSPFQGWVIMVVQALGRITPLFILAFLAILGINATSFLVKHKDKVAKITAWATVYVGGFLLTLGLFGHDWWILSGTHTLFEIVTQENFITNLLGSKVQELGHTHGTPTGSGLFGLPIIWGTPFLLLTWTLPSVWYLFKRKQEIISLPEAKKSIEMRYFRLLGWFFVLVSILLITIFGYLLPHMFAEHWSKGHGMMESEDFHITLSPSTLTAGVPILVNILVHDEKGNSIQDLEIGHERILHVVIVSEDLEEFRHIHPEDFGVVSRGAIQQGKFQVSLAFGRAGKYRLLVDARRKGEDLSDLLWLTVGGLQNPVFIQKDLSTVKVFDGYKVTLTAKQPQAGSEAHLQYIISKDGKPIANEPYLGADMHIVLMPVDLSVMVHTHGFRGNSMGRHSAIPKVDANGSGAIEAHFMFPFPGLWKLFGQFQYQGKVVTTEFMVEVAAGKNDSMVAPHMDGDNHQ